MPSLGQQTSSSSLPVVLASDQATIPVSVKSSSYTGMVSTLNSTPNALTGATYGLAAAGNWSGTVEAVGDNTTLLVTVSGTKDVGVSVYQYQSIGGVYKQIGTPMRRQIATGSSSPGAETYSFKLTERFYKVVATVGSGVADNIAIVATLCNAADRTNPSYVNYGTIDLGGSQSVFYLDVSGMNTLSGQVNTIGVKGGSDLDRVGTVSIEGCIIGNDGSPQQYSRVLVFNRDSGLQNHYSPNMYTGLPSFPTQNSAGLPIGSKPYIFQTDVTGLSIVRITRVIENGTVTGGINLLGTVGKPMDIGVARDSPPFSAQNGGGGTNALTTLASAITNQQLQVAGVRATVAVAGGNGYYGYTGSGNSSTEGLTPVVLTTTGATYTKQLRSWSASNNSSYQDQGTDNQRISLFIKPSATTEVTLSFYMDGAATTKAKPDIVVNFAAGVPATYVFESSGPAYTVTFKNTGSGSNSILYRVVHQAATLMPDTLSAGGNLRTAIAEPLPAGTNVIGAVTISGAVNVTGGGGTADGALETGGNLASIATSSSSMDTKLGTVNSGISTANATLTAVNGKLPTGLTVTGSALNVSESNSGAIATATANTASAMTGVQTNTSNAATSLATVVTNTGGIKTSVDTMATSNATIATNTTDASGKLATIVTSNSTIATNTTEAITKLDTQITSLASLATTNASINTKVPTGMTVSAGSLLVSDPAVGNSGYALTTTNTASALNSLYGAGGVVTTTGLTATTVLPGNPVSMSYSFAFQSGAIAYFAFTQIGADGATVVQPQYVTISAAGSATGTVILHPNTKKVTHKLYSSSTSILSAAPSVLFASSVAVSSTLKSNMSKAGNVLVSVAEDLTAMTLPFSITGGYYSGTPLSACTMLQSQLTQPFVPGATYGITGMTIYSGNNIDGSSNSYGGPGAFIGISPSCGVNTITSIMASDIPSLAGPTDVFITNDGKNVYCTSMNNIIYMYSRDAVTGVLTALATPTVATGTTPTKMAFSPDGSLAYVCNTGANTIWCYSRDATTGMLTYRSSTAIGYAPSALTITPDGVNMYVISKTGGFYLQYSIQKTTGVLTIIGSATTLTYGNICDVQSSANGKEIHFLFSAPYLHTAKRNPFTGVLTFPYVLQSPAGAGVDTFALSPDGGCIYTPLASSSKLAMHPFTPGTGYTNGSQYYDGTNNLYGLSGGSSAAVTPDSTVVWLANTLTGAIVGYDRCSVSGRLVGDGGDRQANIGAAISNIKLSPDGNHIYFVNKTTNAIGRITIDNGMRPLNNIMISAGNYATSMSSWATTQVIQKAFAKPILVKPLNGVFQLYGWLGQPVTIQGTLEMYRLT